MQTIFRTIFLLVAAALACVASGGQQAPASPDPSTLHVYVNRMQIPVLVLNASHEQEPRLPENAFRLTVEGLGEVKPTRVRLEGDDPLGIALLVDRSDRDEPLWKDLPQSLGPLLAQLTPRDRISVYAMDGCKARRFGPELMPMSESAVRAAAEQVALMKAYSETKRETGPCPKPLSYWDMLFYSAHQLLAFPGRRILVTVGASGSAPSAEVQGRLRELLVGESITLFPVLHATTPSVVEIPYVSGRQLRSGGQAREMAIVNPSALLPAMSELAMQAEMSGGIVTGTSVRDFAKSLARPIVLARGRYIVEFPRPDQLKAGSRHQIFISDGHPRDFIRPAGISVPAAGPNERTDHAAADAAATDAVAATSAETPASAPLPVPAAAASSVATPAQVTALPAVPQREPDHIPGDLQPSR